MLRIPISIFLLVPLAAPALLQSSGDPSPRSPEQVLAKFDWLAGTWTGEAWGGRFEAHYSTPVGGRILGHSRLYKKEEVVYYEFEVFELRGKAVTMTPYPGGERAGGFELERETSKGRKMVFENPDKDYPTRIVYERFAEDRLVITLSDPHGGGEKVEVFDLKR